MTLLALPAEGSVFRGTLGFFAELGIYDVVLPFLLVFTIVFAILEKTAAFGKEKVGDGKTEFTRKNLNAMVAFCAAFFVVASTQLVAIISTVMAHTVMLLLLSICFLMLAGSFHSGKEEFFLHDPWKTVFMVIMFVGIILIFLNALGWLAIIWEYLFFRFDSTTVSSIVLALILIGMIGYVTSSKDGKPKEDKK
jgi:hypothetical protein